MTVHSNNEKQAKIIKEVVKQFENEEEDVFRTKSIELISSLFDYSSNTAELWLDIALYGEGVYYTENDKKFRFEVVNNRINFYLDRPNGNSSIAYGYTFYGSFDTPIEWIIEDLDKKTKAMDKIRAMDLPIEDFKEIMVLF